jgi:hypothetical protein
MSELPPEEKSGGGRGGSVGRKRGQEGGLGGMGL